MEIIISNADGKPIYEQIYGQLRGAILRGALKEGDLLPSIRALAHDLRISVITTKRAYDELERDGYVNVVAGKGCYVAPRNAALTQEKHLMEIEGLMARICELAPGSGLNEDELAELLRQTLRQTD